MLLDNRTVFGDVIYDLNGYRQERIKVAGYRTDEWNGSISIPVSFTTVQKLSGILADYDIGAIVKYKEFYYVTDQKYRQKHLLMTRGMIDRQT